MNSLIWTWAEQENCQEETEQARREDPGVSKIQAHHDFEDKVPKNAEKSNAETGSH